MQERECSAWHGASIRITGHGRVRTVGGVPRCSVVALLGTVTTSKCSVRANLRQTTREYRQANTNSRGAKEAARRAKFGPMQADASNPTTVAGACGVNAIEPPPTQLPILPVERAMC